MGLVFSPDGRTLYHISEIATAGTAPNSCNRGEGPLVPQGILYVIDVATAAKRRRIPSVPVSRPVAIRCVLSCRATAAAPMSGQGAPIHWKSSTLPGWSSDGAKARIASIPVGIAPVGVAVTPDHVVVANSNRFAGAGSKLEWLSVIDPATNWVIGDIPAGGFRAR